MEAFADRLIEKAKRVQSRVIVGLDPVVTCFPAYLQEQLRHNPTESQLEEILVDFNRVVVEATAAVAVAYKPQAAFYEQYGLAGLQALLRTIALLREREQLVILDGKRNDVAHTAGAYATAWLAPRHPLFDTPNPWQVDGVTLNGYLGSDGILPFMAANTAAGLFVLTKTSNPSSGELQDRPLWDGVGGAGVTVAEKMAELVHQWGQSSLGRHGFSNVGMVVGATYPAIASRLRDIAPQALFLMPGIGAQGGSLGAIVAGSGAAGVGAYAASSRGLLYPFQPAELPGADWPEQAGNRIEAAARNLQQTIQARLQAAGFA
ncbi:MAG: orotidine-5'-phosphate decarboxylase [Magnetococcales bacterium]|nr:orotidine-5'-phosphate decarboxylase [Magnetococcales bacterium]